jgi:hypothetical protein
VAIRSKRWQSYPSVRWFHKASVRERGCDFDVDGQSDARGGKGAISVFSNVDNCGHAFDFVMNCVATSRISALLGLDRLADAGQLLCNLFRCWFVCGMICPAIFHPAATSLPLVWRCI